MLLSERIYDLAFAIYAIQISGKASAGATVYAFGYFAEITASILGATVSGRLGRLQIFQISISVKIIIFLILAWWNYRYGLDVWSICVFAWLIDFVHHLSRQNSTLAGMCFLVSMP